METGANSQAVVIEKLIGMKFLVCLHGVWSIEAITSAPSGAVVAGIVAAAIAVCETAWLAARFGFTATVPVRARVEIIAVGWVAAEVEFERTA